MRRALRESDPGEYDALPEEMLEPQLTAELCRLSLQSYPLGAQWLDAWSADLPSLGAKLNSLKLSPSEMLRLVDPEKLEDIVSHWEAREEEEGGLERETERLIFPFQLRSRRKQMQDSREEIDISRKNLSAIRRRLERLVGVTPEGAGLARIRELRQDMLRLEERMDELVCLGRLDIGAWETQYREEHVFASRRHGEIGRQLLQLLSSN